MAPYYLKVFALRLLEGENWWNLDSANKFSNQTSKDIKLRHYVNQVIVRCWILCNVGGRIMSGFIEVVSEVIGGQPPTLPRPRSQEAQKNTLPG